MDANEYQQHIDRLVMNFVASLAKVGHVPSGVQNHLAKDIEQTIDRYLQVKPNQINNKQEN